MRTAIKVTRQRKAGIILIVALSATVAILVRGGPLARAVPQARSVPSARAVPGARRSSCPNYTHYVGYLNLGFPPVGTTEGLYINFQSAVRSSGSIRGYMNYGNNLGDSLTAGVLNTGDGPEVYIEYDGVFHGKWTASYGTAYHIWFTHDSPADVTAHVGGLGSYSAIVHSSSTYQPYMYIESSSANNDGICNQYGFDFSGLEPWTISDFSEPLYDAYYNGPIEVSDTEFKTYLHS